MFTIKEVSRQQYLHRRRFSAHRRSLADPRSLEAFGLSEPHGASAKDPGHRLPLGVGAYVEQ
ncbi:MAG: hypothetical protein ACFNUI_03090 [Negativicutes bacterium]